MTFLILDEKIFMALMVQMEVFIYLFNSGPRGKDGKNGGKTIIRVPCGTLVY